MTSELAGRTILITGPTSGIGKSTAMALAARGARLVLAARSMERGQAVVDEIAARTGNRDVTVVPLDLGDLDSVRACAARVNALPGPLHVLINNAGQAGQPGLTKDGFEPAFGINHLGPFLLTMLLIDKLRASAPSRIVTVASRAHRRIRDIDLSAQRRPKRSLGGLYEYSLSKLANILFSAELGRRLAGTGVTTYSLHPGVIASDIWRRLPQPLLWLSKRLMISNDEGALTTIHCATAPEVASETGLYYDRCKPVEPSPAGRDRALAQRLWAASAAWVAADLPASAPAAEQRA